MKRVLLRCAVVGCMVTIGTGLCAFAPGPGAPRGGRFHVEVLAIPLRDVCWVMEKRSGVPHRAADAATGDLRVSILGDLSVDELRPALSDVLGVTWRRIDSDSGPRFVAQRSAESVSEQRRDEQEADRAFRDGLARLVRASFLSDEALKGAPDDLRLAFRSSDWRAATQSLSYLSEDEPARLLGGFEVRRPVAALPPAARALVRTMVEESNKSGESLAVWLRTQPGAANVPPFEPIDLQDGSPWVLRIRPAPELRRPEHSVLMVTVFLPSNGRSTVGWCLEISTPSRALADPSAGQLPRTGPEPDGQAWRSPLAITAESLPRICEGYRNFGEFLCSQGRETVVRTLTLLSDADYFKRFLLRVARRVKLGYRCMAAKTMIDADRAGNLYACSSFTRGQLFPIGTLDDGFDQGRIRTFIEEAYIDNKPVCMDCWARYLCGGGCYYLATLRHGNPLVPDPVDCELVRCVAEVSITALHRLQQRHPDVVAQCLLTRGAEQPGKS